MKNFIYADFESKYERTVFKKVPGAPPVAIFYTQSGKELERVNLEKFDRYVTIILSCTGLISLYCQAPGSFQAHFQSIQSFFAYLGHGLTFNLVLVLVLHGDIQDYIH